MGGAPRGIIIFFTAYVFYDPISIDDLDEREISG